MCCIKCTIKHSTLSIYFVHSTFFSLLNITMPFSVYLQLLAPLLGACPLYSSANNARIFAHLTLCPTMLGALGLCPSYSLPNNCSKLCPSYFYAQQISNLTRGLKRRTTIKNRLTRWPDDFVLLLMPPVKSHIDISGRIKYLQVMRPTLRAAVGSHGPSVYFQIS